MRINQSLALRANLSNDSKSTNTARQDTLMKLIVFVPYFILPFSTFLSFFSALGILLIFAPAIGGTQRVALGICAIISGSILNGDARVHSDMENYYATYLKFLQGNIYGIFDYGRGIEILSPLIFLLMSKVIGAELSSQHFLALNILVASGCFYLWLEKYATTYMNREQKALCVAFAILFFDFWFSGWLQRQTLSSIFILYALSAKSQKSAILFSIVAILFHTSALLFLPIVFLLKYHPKIGLLLCGIVLVGFYFWQDISNSFYGLKQGNIFTGIVSDKLAHYATLKGFDGRFIGIRHLLMVIFLLISAVLAKTYFKQWRYVVIGLTILYIGSVCVSAHFSLRIGIILMFVSFGYFLFIALRKYPLLVRFVGVFALFNQMSVLTYFGDLANTMRYYNYDIIDTFFYWLLP